MIVLVVSVVALAMVMAARAIGGSEQARRDPGPPAAAQTSTAPASKPSLKPPARPVRNGAAQGARNAPAAVGRVIRAIGQHKMIVGLV